MKTQNLMITAGMTAYTVLIIVLMVLIFDDSAETYEPTKEKSEIYYVCWSVFDRHEIHDWVIIGKDDNRTIKALPSNRLYAGRDCELIINIKKENK